MVIDGKQYIIVWYIDNNKILHTNPELVDNIIKKIEEKLGRMTVNRGEIT